MKRTPIWLFVLALICISAIAGEPAFDPDLAKKLGADEPGVKAFVLCILKTGPQDAESKGKEREEIFAGHFASISRLADGGKRAVAGPVGTNERAWRGLY